MVAQLLMYESAVPVTAARHKACGVEAGRAFTFARGLNAVPLTAVEFAEAAPEYAIVFAKSGEGVVPVVVLGARQAENLYVDADGHWQARYIPAFVRRYPFVFSSDAAGENFTLCIDEAFRGLNWTGQGRRLFDDAGQPTPYVDEVLKFLQEYRAQYLRTQAFGQRLQEAGLLEPMHAQFALPAGEKLSLDGFSAVNREKLRALPAETLAELLRNDGLELIYLHLQSLRNFAAVKDRLVAQAAAASPGEPVATTA